MRLAKRLLITLVILGGLLVLMQWILDVPAQYPDHGLAVIPEDLLPLASCLAAEIELDPSSFGVGQDFQIIVEEGVERSHLEVRGWFRSSTLTSTDDTTLQIESDLNPFADGDTRLTACGSF